MCLVVAENNTAIQEEESSRLRDIANLFEGFYTLLKKHPLNKTGSGLNGYNVQLSLDGFEKGRNPLSFCSSPGDGELVLEGPELSLEPLVPLGEGQAVVDGVGDVVAVQPQVARGVAVRLRGLEIRDYIDHFDGWPQNTYHCT